jgi:23S rRNA pseudouridine1911/1915/1917 synthase
VSPVHRFTVPEHLAATRLDRCVADLHGEWSRSRVHRLIDDGRVLVNGEAGKPATPVAAGDQIEVDEPPLQKLDLTAEDIPLVILHEDDELLVLDKPPGLVIHPAAGRHSGTLVNALLQHCSELSGIGGVERPGIVHRLDKDTSGLMVVGKTLEAVTALVRAIAARAVQREYLAIAHGECTPGRRRVEAPIGRDPASRVRMAVVAGGRASATDVETVAAKDGFSALRCTLHTGRTHQIRVHLAHLKHPLVADSVYGGRPALGMQRQALHATRLEFDHPIGGRRLRFERLPPADFAAAWALVAGEGRSR